MNALPCDVLGNFVNINDDTDDDVGNLVDVDDVHDSDNVDNVDKVDDADNVHSVFEVDNIDDVDNVEKTENGLSLEKGRSDSENARNCDINLGAISDDTVLTNGGNETVITNGGNSDLEGRLEERGNSVQMVQCEGENVANIEHFVRGGDDKNEHGNGGHNVPGDRWVQGGQGCGGDNSDQMVQSGDDKNVQDSANLNVPDDMNVHGVHGEQISEDNSEQMVRSGDMENVQGNSDQNVPVEVNSELREVLEKLCMVVIMDEGRDEPRIVGCNVAGGTKNCEIKNSHCADRKQRSQMRQALRAAQRSAELGVLHEMEEPNVTTPPPPPRPPPPSPPPPPPPPPPPATCSAVNMTTTL